MADTLTGLSNLARSGRCPDGGYCHGQTLAAGSEPCPEGSCFRVRNAGPLSGVFPGDRWPDDVRAANGVQRPIKATDRERQVVTKLAHGRTYPWIADELHISATTVRQCVRTTIRRNGFADRQALVDAIVGGAQFARLSPEEFQAERSR